MNTTNSTISTQFNRLAPSTVKLGRKTYTRRGGLFCDASNTVRFDYVGRKQRGAFLADKVTVAVAYVAGLDLYDVTAQHFDGATLDAREILAIEGATWEVFADLGLFIGRAA